MSAFLVNAEGMASNPHPELGFSDAAASRGVPSAQPEHGQVARAALTRCLGQGASQGSGLFGARMMRLANPVLQALPATPNGWILDEKDKSLQNRLMVIMGCNRTGRLYRLELQKEAEIGHDLKS